jgi:hypothetical protein
MQTSTRTPLARQRYLPSSGLWTLCYKRCVSIGTQDTEAGHFSQCLIFVSTEVFGALFPRSFEGRYINSGSECTDKCLNIHI